MIDLNKVGSTRYKCHGLYSDCPQKFRLYVLDSDRATDVLAYLLCYGLEIKDKPRAYTQRIRPQHT